MLRVLAPSLALVGLPLLLGGCGPDPAPTGPVGRDPAVAAALADPLPVDPDLVEQNQQSAVLALAGPAGAPVPPIERSDDVIGAARAEAAQLLGASPPAAPPPDPASGPAVSRSTARQTAAAALAEWGQGSTCAGRLGYAMIWAARLPAALPVYPRGHAQEAAGSDEPDCRLRVVHFLTPVPAAEVVDFYWARARSAGLAPEHRIAGADHVVRGRRGALAVAVYVTSNDGLSAVDLVTRE